MNDQRNPRARLRTVALIATVVIAGFLAGWTATGVTVGIVLGVALGASVAAHELRTEPRGCIPRRRTRRGNP
jgi:NhaP-type Na+/H+ or K+/H+ antiporter